MSVFLKVITTETETKDTQLNKIRVEQAKRIHHFIKAAVLSTLPLSKDIFFNCPVSKSGAFNFREKLDHL